MKNLSCIIYGKCRKFEKPKISYFLEKKVVLSIVCIKCKNEEEKIFKEEESIEILKILHSTKIYNYFKNKVEENISQEFRLKNIDETRNYILEEIEQNELISRTHKKVCITLNYIERTLF